MARCIRGHPGISQCVSRHGILACDLRIRLLRRSIMFRTPRPRSQLSHASARHSRPPQQPAWGTRSPRLHEIQELGSQRLAAQFVREARSLFARGAAAQPVQTVAVAFADFVRRKSRDLRPRGRRGRSHGLGRSSASVDGPFGTSAATWAGAFPARTWASAGTEDTTSFAAFASVEAPFEVSATAWAGDFPARTWASTLADWAWALLPWAARNERHPSSDPIRWAIR